jgi:glycosyltransferase involved in cell wall biosynthesis
LPENITVIHHGFDTELFSKKRDEKESLNVLASHKLKAKNYLLYVGAIQPRKNLGVLIAAFEKLKKVQPDLKLVFAGAPAWKHEETFEQIEKSEFKADIIVTGTVAFDELPVLYQNAAVFVFPSLYEGFGIPVLEAFASGVPVVVADNSSLREVGGEAAIYFKTEDGADLLQKLESILSDETLRNEHIKKGLERSAEFSWEKCAQLTLDNIKK